MEAKRRRVVSISDTHVVRVAGGVGYLLSARIPRLCRVPRGARYCDQVPRYRAGPTSHLNTGRGQCF